MGNELSEGGLGQPGVPYDAYVQRPPADLQRKPPPTANAPMQRNTISNPATLHQVAQQAHDRGDSMSLTSNASGGSFRRSWSSSCSSPVTPTEPDLSFLSEEERLKIFDVMARAHQMDAQDEDRIVRIESEINQLEKHRSKGPVVPVPPVVMQKCAGCGLQSQRGDNLLKTCAKCSERICDKCATPTVDEIEPGVLCSVCEKRRQLLATSGLWFHGSKQDRRQLENVFLDIAVDKDVVSASASANASANTSVNAPECAQPAKSASSSLPTANKPSFPVRNHRNPLTNKVSERIEEELNDTSTASAYSRTSSVSGAEAESDSVSGSEYQRVQQTAASHDSGFEEQPRSSQWAPAGNGSQGAGLDRPGRLRMAGKQDRLSFAPQPDGGSDASPAQPSVEVAPAPVQAQAYVFDGREEEPQLRPEASPRCVSPPLSPRVQLLGAECDQPTLTSCPFTSDPVGLFGDGLQDQDQDQFADDTVPFAQSHNPFGDYSGLQHAQNVFTMFQQPFATLNDQQAESSTFEFGDAPGQPDFQRSPNLVSFGYDADADKSGSQAVQGDSQLQYDPSPFIYDSNSFSATAPPDTQPVAGPDQPLELIELNDAAWLATANVRETPAEEQPVVFDLAAFAASIASDTEKLTSAIERTAELGDARNERSREPESDAKSIVHAHAPLAKAHNGSAETQPADDSLLRLYCEDYPVAHRDERARAARKSNQVEPAPAPATLVAVAPPLPHAAENANGPDISDTQGAITQPCVVSNKDGATATATASDALPLPLPLPTAAMIDLQTRAERAAPHLQLPIPGVRNARSQSESAADVSEASLPRSDCKSSLSDAQHETSRVPRRKKLPVPNCAHDSTLAAQTNLPVANVLTSVGETSAPRVTSGSAKPQMHQLITDLHTRASSASPGITTESLQQQLQLQQLPQSAPISTVPQVTCAATTLVSTIIQASAAIIAASIEQQLKIKQPEVAEKATQGVKRTHRILPLPPQSEVDAWRDERDKSSSDRFSADERDTEPLERLSWSSPLMRASTEDQCEDDETVEQLTTDSDRERERLGRDDLALRSDDLGDETEAYSGRRLLSSDRYSGLRLSSSPARWTQRGTSRSFEDLGALDYSMVRSVPGKARSVVNYARHTSGPGTPLMLSSEVRMGPYATSSELARLHSALAAPRPLVDYTNTETVLDIDLEILRKEGRIRRLEREFAVKKREIDEATRLQAELRKACESLEARSALEAQAQAQPQLQPQPQPQSQPASLPAPYAHLALPSTLYAVPGGTGAVATTLDALEPVQPVLVQPTLTPYNSLPPFAPYQTLTHDPMSVQPAPNPPNFGIPLAYPAAQIAVTEVDGLARFFGRETYTAGEYAAHRSVADDGRTNEPRLIHLSHRRYPSPSPVYRPPTTASRNAHRPPSPRRRPPSARDQTYRESSPRDFHTRSPIPYAQTLPSRRRPRPDPADRASPPPAPAPAPTPAPAPIRSSQSSRSNQRNRSSTFSPSVDETRLSKPAYAFPVKRILLTTDYRDRQRGTGLRVVGGRRTNKAGELGAYVVAVEKPELVNGEVNIGDRVLEWNGVPLTNKTFEQVQQILGQEFDESEVEIVVSSADSEPQRSTNGNRSASRGVDGAKAASKHRSAKTQSEGGNGNSEAPEEQRTRETPKPAPVPTNTETPNNARQPAEPLIVAAEAKPVVTVSEASDANTNTAATKKRTEAAVKSQSTPTHGKSRSGHAQSTNRQQSNNSAVDKYIQPSYEHVNTPPDSGQYGEIEIQVSHDDYDQSLTVHVSRARGLIAADINGLSDPFVKVELFPLRDPDQTGTTRAINNTLTPEWQQTLVLFKVHKRALRYSYLNVTAYDYDRFKENDVLGQVLVPLGDKRFMDNKLHWYTLHAVREPLLEWLPAEIRTAVENERAKAASKHEPVSKKKSAGSASKDKK